MVYDYMGKADLSKGFSNRGKTRNIKRELSYNRAKTTFQLVGKKLQFLGQF